jgi:hypothetical protein
MGVISTQVTPRTDGRQMASNHRRNPFKQRDVTRAVRSAEAAGLAVDSVEVVTKDGVTIRVFGRDRSPVASNANPWDEPANAEKRPA